VILLATLLWLSGVLCRAEETLEVGFAHVDITPAVNAETPVWLAGYYPGRAATGVHDPLYARCVVLKTGTEKLAWVSVDLIGLQFPEVQRLRARLRDFRYVLVASTHNHEGPDVIGVWGQSFLHRGVDDQYVASVIVRLEQVVRQAEQRLREARAWYGTAADDSLLGDSRLPVVKDGVLRLLRFTNPHDDAVTGLIVQWNCHPEALGGDNQLITADFPASTIAALERRYACPVVYFTGAIGGLLAPPRDRIRNEQGELLKEGDFEFARRYGEEVAQLAMRANEGAQPIGLMPFQVSAARTGIPMTNELYRWARLLGVLRREAYAWNGEDAALGEPLRSVRAGATSAIETEVACLRLGELYVAAMPGELFPELVRGPVEDPAQPGADYPESPIEPLLTDIVPGDKWLLFGLANDEVGYIMPRRQWDRQPPYAYGLSAPQYGEINSCGPDVAPVIMKSLQARVAELWDGRPACQE
jgi:hypothetical protein